MKNHRIVTAFLCCLIGIYSCTLSARGADTNTIGGAGTNAPAGTSDARWVHLNHSDGGGGNAPEKVMAGVWNITTVGKQGQSGWSTQSLNQKIPLTFHDHSTSTTPMITGTPFGFTTVKASISTAQTNGPVQFKTGTKVGPAYYFIDWKGTLSPDGTQITDGKFSFMYGTGTFTAVKDSKK